MLDNDKLYTCFLCVPNEFTSQIFGLYFQKLGYNTVNINISKINLTKVNKKNIFKLIKLDIHN